MEQPNSRTPRPFTLASWRLILSEWAYALSIQTSLKP
jgi:hypothetical protein